MPRAKTNRTAINETVKALRTAGRLRAEHEALVTAAVSLALAVDVSPGNDRLWREYRAAVEALMEVSDVDGDDGGAADFLAAVRTQVGNGSNP